MRHKRRCDGVQEGCSLLISATLSTDPAVTVPLDLGIASVFYSHYRQFSNMDFTGGVGTFHGMAPLFKLYADKLNLAIPVKEVFPWPTLPKAQNPGTVVGFSGGLDSSYLALKERSVSRTVVLCHLRGLNGQFANETSGSRAFADHFGFSYYSVTFPRLKQVLPENPFKNQFTLACQLELAVKLGLNAVSQGSFVWNELRNLENKHGVTDASEFYTLLQSCWGAYGVTVGLIPVPKSGVYRWLWAHHGDAFPFLQSCMSPHRFRGIRSKAVQERYPGVLLPGRCGYCHKCCMEWLNLVFIRKKSLTPVEVGYKNHCLSALRRHGKNGRLGEVRGWHSKMTDLELIRAVLG